MKAGPRSSLLYPVSPENAGESAEVMDEELDEQGQERERVEVKVRKDPGEPTKEEINRHNVTHLPYRSWCPICVKAKGKIRAQFG